MANYKWPDVYPTIKDLSGVVATNSVTTCAYVGEAEFGPINKPTFLSTLKDYTNIFGVLNSAKYGYAGYSLAVASESIDSHYFVRVVKTGEAGAHEDDDAMYASVRIPTATAETSPVGTGWYVEEIAEVLKNEDGTGLFVNSTYHLSEVEIQSAGTAYAANDELVVSLDTTNAKLKVTGVDIEGKITSVEIAEAGANTTGDVVNPVSISGGTGTGATFNIKLSNEDLDNGLVFVADNPNNLKLFVRLTNSTVNENRAYPFEGITYTATGTQGVYTATISGVNTDLLPTLSAGNSIEIIRLTNKEQCGIYTINTVDATNRTVTYTYKNTTLAPSNVTDGNGKVSKYPEPNERTFQVEVLQTIGRVTTVVETYQFCTLYQAKDNYGNSMFVEDVINGSSDYVRVYVNNNLLNELEEGEVLEIALSGEVIALTGGKAGGKPSSKELNSAWSLFEDRTQTNVSLLMNSGYSNKTETSYQNAMLDIANARRDCFCLFDIPASEVEADDAIDWRKNILGSNSYRAALSSPWVKTYDSVQGRANFLMCPSAYVAKLIGQAGDPWHAPAGPNRGIISSSTVSPTGLTQSYDPEVGGILYADNQINCLIRDASAGYVNWGQRTLQQKPSALDRINVARTVIYIETVLRDAARWHLFENNTPFERMQITLQFSAFLDTILSADGIAAYQVICDSSNNTPIVIQNNQLVIDVILTPVYAAETIILNTTVTGADASVTVTSSAN